MFNFVKLALETLLSGIVWEDDSSPIFTFGAVLKLCKGTNLLKRKGEAGGGGGGGLLPPLLFSSCGVLGVRACKNLYPLKLYL